MPQYRQNFITKEWVIVAPERAKRPDQFAKKAEEKIDVPPHDPKCPFCPGNESQTPPPSLEMSKGDGWQLRVVPNKFAAVNPETSPSRRTNGLFLSADGFGIAEVIVESPLHNTSLEQMSVEEVRNVICAYQARYTALAANPDIDLITIFRNHGKSAGTSLLHPHSQVIATPIVPPRIRNNLQQAIIYHDSNGTCPYCDAIAGEIADGSRIVMETQHFVAYCPYASHVPFETRIMPKRHASQFSAMNEAEVDDLAKLFRTVLRKIYVGLSDPDYNMVIGTSPASDGELHYDHWRMTITPRITTPAGFEIGSSIFINIMPPENAAAFLRDTKAD